MAQEAGGGLHVCVCVLFSKCACIRYCYAAFFCRQYLQPHIFSHDVMLHHYAHPYRMSLAGLRFISWLRNITLLFVMFSNTGTHVRILLANALSKARCLWSCPSGQGQAWRQISKKVREQLSLKCQILWPEPWWDWKKLPHRQIDTQTRYGK